MSVRPRNRQPLGTGGIVRLGSSNLNPNLSEFVDNGTPGFPADSFITVENRLAQPLNVSPSLFGASPDYASYETVPPLTRSTVPIDPQRGVLLTVNPEIALNDRDGIGTPVVRTFEKRTIPYRLHSDGAAPSEPVYPLERCMFATQDLVFVPGNVSFYFVGGAWPGASNRQMASGADGICIVAVTCFLYGVSALPAGSLFEAGAYYDPDNTSQKVAIPLAFGGNVTPVGTRVTFAVNGAVAIGFGVGGAGSVSATFGFWIGMPGA